MNLITLAAHVFIHPLVQSPQLEVQQNRLTVFALHLQHRILQHEGDLLQLLKIVQLERNVVGLKPLVEVFRMTLDLCISSLQL